VAQVVGPEFKLQYLKRKIQWWNLLKLFFKIGVGMSGNDRINLIKVHYMQKWKYCVKACVQLIHANKNGGRKRKIWLNFSNTELGRATFL
jgi:hypothetical protein